MDDDKLLEELHAQRDLIQKHLDWIEQKIADVSLKESSDAHPLSPAEAEPSKTATRSETSTEPASSLKPDSSTEEVKEKEILQAYKPSSGKEVRRAKIGCLLLFILSTALFLFLLFGLPYLLD